MIGTGHIHEDMSFFHASSIGVFAFNCIIGGLIGGLAAIYRLCMAVVTIIRCILVGFGQSVLKIQIRPVSDLRNKLRVVSEALLLRTE